MPVDDESGVSIPFPRIEVAEPLLTLVNQSRHATGWVTSVTRVFERHVGFCGRCPPERCNAVMGVCLVSVQGFVSDDDAPGLRTDGLPWLDVPTADDLGRSRGGGA
jgi:hypothetical protein